MNKIVLVGRLVADPEVRYTQGGDAVANFCVAVDRRYKDKTTGEKVTDFINIVAWRKLAELIGQYLKKGRLVSLDGSLQIRKYQAKDGTNRSAAEIVADNVNFLDRGNGINADNQNSNSNYNQNQGQTLTPQPTTNPAQSDPFNMSAAADDLPF